MSGSHVSNFGRPVQRDSYNAELCPVIVFRAISTPHDSETLRTAAIKRWSQASRKPTNPSTAYVSKGLSGVAQSVEVRYSEAFLSRLYSRREWREAYLPDR